MIVSFLYFKLKIILKHIKSKSEAEWGWVTLLVDIHNLINRHMHIYDDQVDHNWPFN